MAPESQNTTTKKLILLSYLSDLFSLRLLCENSYLLEGLQSADKTKKHPPATSEVTNLSQNKNVLSPPQSSSR